MLFVRISSAGASNVRPLMGLLTIVLLIGVPARQALAHAQGTICDSASDPGCGGPTCGQSDVHNDTAWIGCCLPRHRVRVMVCDAAG